MYFLNLDQESNELRYLLCTLHNLIYDLNFMSRLEQDPSLTSKKDKKVKGLQPQLEKVV